MPEPQVKQPEQFADRATCLQISKAINHLVEIGAIPDYSIENEMDRQLKQQYKKRTVYNTRCLLENYRKISKAIIAHGNDLIIEQQLNEPFEQIDKLLISLDVKAEFDPKRSDKFISNLEKIRIARDLIGRLHMAVSGLKNKQYGTLMYDLIYARYLSLADEEPESVDEICTRLNLSRSYEYKIRRHAIEMISAQLWATPDKYNEQMLLINEIMISICGVSLIREKS